MTCSQAGVAEAVAHAGGRQVYDKKYEAGRQAEGEGAWRGGCLGRQPRAERQAGSIRGP